MVFVILFFIFILQSVWLFIAELAGKDLDLVMVLKFLLFAMPRIVPLVLPLSVLLASIMTFGNLAENYEFAAMKSAGISLAKSYEKLDYLYLVIEYSLPLCLPTMLFLMPNTSSSISEETLPN